MQAEQSDELVISLRAAARGLIGHRSLTDLEQTLAGIVAAAVETVPGVDAGGISMTEGADRHVTSRSPTTDDVRSLDELQSELCEGPCVTAALQPPDDGVIIARDLAEDPDASYWPRFAPRAVTLGFRSMMSTHLSANGPRRAALNLYSHSPGTFDQSARTVAGLFGAQAALLLYGAEHAAQMAQALGTRDLIGQAKGILMERFSVDDDGAFQMLVRSSQDTNVKLVDVARWLTSGDGRAGADPPDVAR